MTLRNKWLVVVIGALLLAAAFVNFFDWNLARPYIARKVESYTGRSFAIDRDLKVSLSLRPRVVANQVILGNAAWSHDANMAEIGRIEFTIDLLKLFYGRWEFPEVTLSDWHLILESNKDGASNWVFNEKDKNQSSGFPAVGALMIDHGTVIYRDPTAKTDLSLDVSAPNRGKDESEPLVELSGKGLFKGVPAVVRARGGALLSLRSADRPYPIKVDLTLGATKANFEGVLLDPLHLQGEELNFMVQGSDLSSLFPIIGVPVPPTPPYKLAGFLSHAGTLWKFTRFNGTVGQSNLAGDFSVDRGVKPQMITATLVSRRLEMKDLGGFIGVNRGEEAGKMSPRNDKVLPSTPINLEKLRAADADVRFTGEKIITETLPFENMEAHLIVKSGTLQFVPLSFGVAGGHLVLQIKMDGSKPRIAIRADIAAQGLHLDQLFPTVRFTAASAGTLGGRSKLEGNGNSIAQMLGTANGNAALIMDGGSISELMLRFSNLDIANSIVVLLGGDKQVPIHCMVSSFKVVDGDFKVETLVLDTPKVSISGSGNLNFADESVHLRLVSQSKGFSLASLRGPIDVTGSFRNPSVHPEMGGVILRGGLAAVLGIATAGVGALLPLLDFGKEKIGNCSALVHLARTDAGVKESDISPHTASKR